MVKREIEYVCKKCGCNLIKERGKFSHMYEYTGKCSTFFLPPAKISSAKKREAFNGSVVDMKLIDVKYTRAERLTADEKRELGIDPRIRSGLIAIEILENIEKTDSPKNIIRRGVVIDSYYQYLIRKGERT
jgi:predicted ATP-dependent serine protease